MKNIGGLSLDNFVKIANDQLFQVGVLVLSLCLLYLLKRRPIAGKGLLLEHLGIAKEEGSIKVKEFNLYFVIKGVHPKFFEKKYWRSSFEKLEHILNRKFIDVEISNNGNIKLFKDLLPEVVESSLKPTLEPMETWLGQNQYGHDVKINLQLSPAVYVDGKPGSGKTVALRAIINGFVEGVKSPVRLVVVSSKPADWFRCEAYTNVDLILINPCDIETENQYKKIIDELDRVKCIEKEFNEIVQNNNIKEDTNFEKLRQQGHTDLNRLFFVFDEAKDYLAVHKSDKSNKELKDLKELLIDRVYTHIRRTSRFLSIPIVVASQTQNEGDLAIPLKMFHLRLASNTNEAMSRIICGDSRLTNLSFNKGKYYVSTDEKEHIVRIPFYN